MQDRAAAVAGEGRGDREQPVAEPFGFPPAGFVLGMGEQARPRGQVAGEGDDGAPDPVLVESVQGEVAQPGVFRLPDAVLAACVPAVPQLKGLELSAAGVGGERDESVPVDVVEPELGAGVGGVPGGR